MALSLPHSYTNYKSLDVLKAEQLNNDNQNNKYIADQFPITTANLADEAVTAAKIANGAITPDKLQAHDIMTVHGEESTTVMNANTNIALNNVVGSNGTGLEAYSGGIRIKSGSGITKVKVSANAYANKNASEGYVWISIYKNSASVSISSLASLASNYASATISPVVISVAEGDVIRLHNNETTKINGVNTYLTVERV